MANQFENYYSFIQDDAESFLNNYFDDFAERIKDGETNAYYMIDDDGKLHEHADMYIDLREAVEILEQSNSVETDSGLWEGLETPEEMLGAKAFWTYKSDLMSEVMEQFKEKLEELLEKVEEEKSELVEKLNELDEDNDDEYDEYKEIETDIDNLNDQIGYIEDAIDSL